VLSLFGHVGRPTGRRANVQSAAKPPSVLRPFNALHDVLLAFLVRNGEIERRVAVRRMVKVHVPPEPEPEPEHVPKVDPAQLTLVDA